MGFPTSGECNIAPELPPNGEPEVYRFDPAGLPLSEIGILVKFVPDAGAHWFGAFGKGAGAAKGQHGGLCGIFGCPDPNSVLVICSGAAFHVTLNNPNQTTELPISPVTEIARAPGRDLLLLTDFTHAYGFGAGGIVWQSERLSHDGLRMLEVGNDTALLEIWVPWLNGTSTCEIDLRSGHKLPARD